MPKAAQLFLTILILAGQYLGLVLYHCSCNVALPCCCEAARRVHQAKSNTTAPHDCCQKKTADTATATNQHSEKSQMPVDRDCPYLALNSSDLAGIPLPEKTIAVEIIATPLPVLLAQQSVSSHLAIQSTSADDWLAKITSSSHTQILRI